MVAVLLAVLGVASTLARRRIGLVHLAVAGVLEALLLVQAVLALVAMAGGSTPPETATFVGYLAGVVLVPVAGVAVGAHRADPLGRHACSRWRPRRRASWSGGCCSSGRRPVR